MTARLSEQRARRILPGGQPGSAEDITANPGAYGLSCSSASAGLTAHAPASVLAESTRASPSLGGRRLASQGESRLHFSPTALAGSRMVSHGSDDGSNLAPEGCLDRRFQPRLGSALRRQTGLWPLVRPGESPSHKLSRDARGRESAQALPPSPPRSPCFSPHGQYISSGLREPPGRRQIQNALHPGGTPPRVGSALTALAESRACAWAPERGSRQTVQGQCSPWGVVLASPNSPVTVAPFRQSESRPLCVRRPRSLPKVLYEERGRAGPDLAQRPTICLPAGLSVATSHQENQGSAPHGAPHSPVLGEPDLVPGANTVGRHSPLADSGETRPSLSSPRLDLASPYRALVSARMETQRIPVDLPEGVVNTITPLRGGSTRLNGLCLKSGALPRGWIHKHVGYRRAQVISLSALPPSGSEVNGNLLCPVRALRNYVTRSAAIRRSEQLFVSFGGRTKGTCILEGDPQPPALFKDGDFIIGGAFTFHYYLRTEKHTYTRRPQPLECSGSMDFRELRFARVLQFAIQEINNSSDLLPGITLGYHIYDSCASVPMVMKVAFQLANGQDLVFNDTDSCAKSAAVIALVGESGSTAAITTSRLFGSFGIPQVSHYATCACLSDKRQYPTFFRTIPSDHHQAAALARMVKRFGWTWIGAVRSDSDYGNNGMASFLKAAAEEGICVEYSEAYYRTQPRSKLKRVADVIRRSTARVIVAFLAAGDMRFLLEELSQQPPPPMQWIGSEAWVTDPQMLRFNLCIGAVGFAIPRSVIPGFRNFLLDLSPEQALTFPLLTEFWENLFSCSLKQQTGSSTGMPACDGTEDLRALQNPYTDTSQLRITNMVYKATYAIAHALHGIVCDEKRCDKNIKIEPRKVFDQLKRINFTKNNYSVSFDTNGDPVATYELVNWQLQGDGSVHFVTVGQYDGSQPKGKEFSLSRTIIWYDGSEKVPVSVCSESCPPGSRKAVKKGKPVCCYDCINCADGEISNETDSLDCHKCLPEDWPNIEKDKCLSKPVEFLSWNEILGIILAAFSIAGFLLALSIALVFYKNMASPIVRANNSELSFLLLFSLTLCFLCSLTFIGRPTEWSCTCILQGDPQPPALFKDGDFIIGGAFTIHYYVRTEKNTFTRKPQPLECSGSMDFRELRFARALQFTIQEINNSSDLLPGITLGYHIYDSCASVPMAIKVALQLANGQDLVFNDTDSCAKSAAIPALVGDSASTPAISISRLLGPFGIPQVSHYATCACLSDKRQHPTFFRTIPSDHHQAAALARMVKHFGWTWIGTVCSDSDYGNNGMASFLKAAENEGICVEYSEAYYRTQPRSKLKKVADVIRRSTARVIVAFVAAGDMRFLLEELSQQPPPPMQWVGSEAWVTDPQMLRFNLCIGAVGVAIPRSVIPGFRNFLLDLSPEQALKFPLLTEFWESSFSCSLKQQTGSSTGMPACDGTEDLRTLQNPYTDTSQLRVTNMVYKATYAIAHALHGIVCNENQCDKNITFEPRQVFDQLKQVNFTKNNYSVSFDTNGDPMATYELVNWQLQGDDSVDFVTVGQYDASQPKGQEFSLSRDIIWFDESEKVPVSVCSESCPPGTRKAVQKGRPVCCYDCINCADGEISNETDSLECLKCLPENWPNNEKDKCLLKPVEFLSWNEILGIILAVFSVVGSSVALSITLVFYKNRASPIVRANNSELSFLLLFSLTLCFLCSLTFIGRPTEWSYLGQPKQANSVMANPF
ncbi:unnamed protein product [Leuciscus chuanchicus]